MLTGSRSLLGVQEPRVLNRPDWLASTGSEAIDLARSAGVHLFPWQELAVEVILGEVAGGDWAAFETAMLVARQNGKGEVILVIELAGLFLLGENLLLHSAHEFKTAREAYLRIRGVIEGAPHLSRLVRQFRQSNEDTSIELTSGARLRFMARSRQSGRGFSAQRLLIDEAQILSAAAMGALMPTLAAQQNPQINYFGTVPGPLDDAEHFTSLRNRGRAGGDPFLGWMEWNSGEETPDLDDPQRWAESSPSLGYMIGEDFIAKERASLSDEDFARERCSVWSEHENSSLIDMNRWVSLADPTPPKSEQVALAVDVTPDRSASTVAFAGLRPDGRRHVEVIENGAGTRWVLDLILERLADRPDAKVLIDATGPAGSLVQSLTDARVAVTLTTARDMGQACGAFFDAVTNDPPSLTHFDQPMLAKALGAAKKRPLGDAWAWARKNTTVDISPLVAVTLALHGLGISEPGKKKRSGKVWY